MSFLEDAKKGIVTEEMKAVALAEGVTPKFVLRGVASGRIVMAPDKGQRIHRHLFGHSSPTSLPDMIISSLP
jgi:thiamine biosynthesis protein ThiC